jgi:hypothetical protein
MDLGHFALVELEFEQNIVQDLYLRFQEEVEKITPTFKTLFFLSTRRWNYYAVFADPTCKVNERQFLRDTLSFLKKVNILLRDHAKMAGSFGTKCLCEIVQKGKDHLTFYSKTLANGSALLSSCNLGDIICHKDLAERLYRYDPSLIFTCDEEIEAEEVAWYTLSFPQE